jgi:hypothetical protein
MTRNQLVTRFQLALFWSTISKWLILNALKSPTHTVDRTAGGHVVSPLRVRPICSGLLNR